MSAEIVSEHVTVTDVSIQCEVCGAWVATGEDVIVRHDIINGGHRWQTVCGCDR